MPKLVASGSGPTVKHHPKDARTGLDRFQKAIGRFPARGPLPSKKFIEERAERGLTTRASH